MTLKEDIYFICKLYVNRFVRLQTKQGQTVEGTIVHVDTDHVHLRLSSGGEGETRLFFPPGPFTGHYPPPPPRPGFYPPPPPRPGPFPPGPFPPGPAPYGPNDQIMTLALFDLLAITLLLL